jgi:hypothetical protein
MAMAIAGQGHDVRRDPEVAHEEKGREHGERDRYGDDQDRAQVEQKQDVHEGDDDRLLDQGPLERGGGPLDEDRPVVEGDDPDTRRQPGWSAAIFSLTRAMTSTVLTP